MNTEEEFQEWLKGSEGKTAADTSILWLDGYQEILIERLRAAYVAGSKANVRRVEACINYCEGASTEYLESKLLID